MTDTTPPLAPLAPLPRLTTSVRQQLLDQNEGLTIETVYRDRNFREVCTYTVKNGELIVRSHGKGAFGGSQFDDTYVADAAKTHRVLYDHQRRFDHSRVDPTLKLPKPKPEPITVVIPDDIVEGLSEDAAPELQARVKDWYQSLSPKERLALGGVVVGVIVGAAVVYRFRKPISAKLKGAAVSVRRTFARRSAVEGNSTDDRRDGA